MKSATGQYRPRKRVVRRDGQSYVGEVSAPGHPLTQAVLTCRVNRVFPAHKETDV